MNEQDKYILGGILNDQLDPLTLGDIQNVEIAQESIVNFIQQYRWSLMIEKINTPANEVDRFQEMTHKINMCNILIGDILDLDKLRKKALKKLAEKDKEKEE